LFGRCRLIVCEGGELLRPAEFKAAREPRLRVDDPLPPDDRASGFEGNGIEALYHGHASRLFRLFARRAGTADAPDLLQETFVRMAGIDAEARRRIENPAAFLTRIAVNLLKDRAKSAAGRRSSFHLEYDEQVHATIDPHPLLDDRDALARLDEALPRLNRRTREIFLLHRVDGLTYAEIAVEVGMSVKGVKKQMAKALFQLRRVVGPL
jgi:RNA polymerase sigma-70 factor (ECF subfamily)